PLQRDPEMHLALALDQRLARILRVGDAQRRVLLDRLLESGGELDVVLPPGRSDGDAEHRVGHGEVEELRRRRLAGRKRHAGAGTVELAEADRLAGLRGLALLGVAAGHPENAGDAAGLAPGA